VRKKQAGFRAGQAATKGFQEGGKCAAQIIDDGEKFAGIPKTYTRSYRNGPDLVCAPVQSGPRYPGS